MPSIIYTSNKSQKKVNKKPGWRQAEEDHKAWLRKHGIDPEAPKKRKQRETYVAPKQQGYVRETPNYPSLGTHAGVAAKKEPQKYTGTLIKGIATMHKSNAIPIISDEQAIEVATMRRN